MVVAWTLSMDMGALTLPRTRRRAGVAVSQEPGELDLAGALAGELARPAELAARAPECARVRPRAPACALPSPLTAR